MQLNGKVWKKKKVGKDVWEGEKKEEMGNERNVKEGREAKGSWKRMKKSKEKERRKRKKRERGKREKEKEEKRKREIEGKGIWRELKGRTFEGRS